MRVPSCALILLVAAAPVACGSEDDPAGTGDPPAVGGSGATGGGTPTSGGTNAGTGGSGGNGAQTASGGGGTGGSAGSPPTHPTAVAEISGFGDFSDLSGTATFTQVDDTVTLVIELENCPAATRVAHIHENKNCGANGDAAGFHWVPNGENLGNFVCGADGTVTHTVDRSTDVWTVGESEDTDVTQFAIVVHEAGDPNPGPRIACGLIDLID